MQQQDGSAGSVVVWRDDVLPASETFVAGQVGAMRRWHPVVAGLYRTPSVLDVRPELVLSPSARWAAPYRRWVRRSGRSRRLDALLRRPDVRVVHAHFGRDAQLVAPAAARARRPLVVTLHGYDVTQLPRHPRTGPAYRAGLRRLFDQAAAVVVVSDFVREQVLALGAHADRLVRLPTGIDPGPAAPPAPPVRRVLFVGRLVEKKGVADLLEAVAALPGDLRGTPVEICGDGPLREDLERRAAELGLTVEFRGHLTPAQLAATYRGGGVFCGPSRSSAAGDAEGLGTVFLEAAAAGLPVVSYRHGGVPEAVEDGVTGHLVPEGDVPALSRALGAVMADGAPAQEMGLAGRRMVERDFDLARQTARLEELYDRVAAGRPVAARR
ncbi:glycosyltransferase [Pseudokineococcus lusitanus]|uniref:Glycosyltransferase involved in cell wall biosynthesis n=1 Tax=Pseudokineococcus lusitanus TaxID=763993 RepID=A0A3N1HR66_9ACTN|nr:glycosyltransferase [Pseudokineococcus lusitanus]ROP44916.1 glycosyltransferase involved in cell wall biosynthesis [Pseudokineococcus lusitanus]